VVYQLLGRMLLTGYKRKDTDMSTNKMLLVVFCAGLLASCSATKQNEWFTSHNGNMPSKERISQLKQGSSKDEVITILGAPSIVNSFDDNTWIYMSSDIKRVAFQKPKEVERNILRISFDKNDKVEKITHLSKNDGREIAPTKDKTEVKGENLGFFRKYFGGVGQYNPFAGNNNATGL